MYSKMRKTYDQNFRIYSFRQNSELEKFLFAKTGFNLRRFTIKDVIDKLEKIILEEELWDETNQEIIFCSDEMERAIDLKAFHVSELEKKVLEQIIEVDQKNTKPLCSTTSIPRKIINKKNKILMDQMFQVSIPLLNILKKVPSFNKMGRIFTFKVIAEGFGDYMVMKKNSFFDQRNIKLAIVKDDELGKVFGVQSFHRCQAKDLLLNQLKPIPKKSSNDDPWVKIDSPISCEYYLDYEQQEDSEADCSWVFLSQNR